MQNIALLCSNYERTLKFIWGLYVSNNRFLMEVQFMAKKMDCKNVGNLFRNCMEQLKQHSNLFGNSGKQRIFLPKIDSIKTCYSVRTLNILSLNCIAVCCPPKILPREKSITSKKSSFNSEIIFEVFLISKIKIWQFSICTTNYQVFVVQGQFSQS